jgi:hypothetical protein
MRSRTQTRAGIQTPSRGVHRGPLSCAACVANTRDRYGLLECVHQRSRAVTWLHCVVSTPSPSSSVKLASTCSTCVFTSISKSLSLAYLRTYLCLSVLYCTHSLLSPLSGLPDFAFFPMSVFAMEWFGEQLWGEVVRLPRPLREATKRVAGAGPGYVNAVLEQSLTAAVPKGRRVSFDLACGFH